MQGRYSSSRARDGLKDRDLFLSSEEEPKQLTKQMQNPHKTHKLSSELDLCVRSGLVLVRALVTSSWQIWDYLSTRRGRQMEMFPPVFPPPSFLARTWEFSPAVTASDDDKQQDDRYRYKSGAAWHCFGHHIYPPALIFLLKSYIISLLCGDVRKIHLILLSRLRSWMNIDH